MKFIERMKMIRDDAVKMSKVLGLVPERIVIDLPDFDRLMEIVEKAHKNMDEICTPFCPVCGGYSRMVGEEDEHGMYETEWAHYDTCPYSDERESK